MLHQCLPQSGMLDAFDRIAHDQIAMAIEGSWRTYSVTLAWSPRDETLRLICAFELAPPARRVPALQAAMALANDRCWTGAFVLWREQKLMGYRYGLNLAGGEWDGKAGGYAIQGSAATFIAWIRGSYSNVVGLPLFEAAAMLRASGLRW